MISIIFQGLLIGILIINCVLWAKDIKVRKGVIASNNELLEFAKLSNNAVETNTRVRIEYNNHIKDLIVAQRACNKRIKDNNKLLRSIKK